MDNSYSHLAKHMSQGDVLQDMTAGKPAFPVKPLDKAVVAHTVLFLEPSSCFSSFLCRAL